MRLTHSFCLVLEEFEASTLPADLGPSGVEVVHLKVYQVVETPPRKEGLMSENTT